MAEPRGGGGGTAASPEWEIFLENFLKEKKKREKVKILVVIWTVKVIYYPDKLIVKHNKLINIKVEKLLMWVRVICNLNWLIKPLPNN